MRFRYTAGSTPARMFRKIKRHSSFAASCCKKAARSRLFPEGVSHNSPKLLPAKTGAARIALGAVSIDSGGEPLDLRIVPVGLFYTSKTTFRSEALLHFGESFRVEPVVLDDNGQPPERQFVL